MSVHKVRVLLRMFDFEACEIAKIKEFAIVNDCFCNERNEKIGLYGQTLVSCATAITYTGLMSPTLLNNKQCNLNNYVLFL